MKNKSILFILLALFAVVLISCSAQQAAPAVEEAAPVEEEAAPAVEEVAPAVEEAVLMVGNTGFTRAQLEAMPAATGDYTSKDGSVTEFTGVLVTDLLSAAGLDGETVVFTASDGYAAEVPLADLQGCADCIVAFDDDELRVVLPGFASSAQVKGVVDLQATGAAPVAEEEAALMVGDTGFTRAQLEAMPATFAAYTDKDGNTTEFTGVLVTDLLAAAGLDGETVVFTASDGYEAEAALADLQACADCIVGFDGDELRSVLPGFSGKAQVKGLAALAVK
jgi:hypothetical protein